LRLYLEAIEQAPEDIEANFVRLDLTDYDEAELMAALADVRELVATWPNVATVRWHRCRHDEGGACEIQEVA